MLSAWVGMVSAWSALYKSDSSASLDRAILSGLKLKLKSRSSGSATPLLSCKVLFNITGTGVTQGRSGVSSPAKVSVSAMMKECVPSPEKLIKFATVAMWHI